MQLVVSVWQGISTLLLLVLCLVAVIKFVTDNYKSNRNVTEFDAYGDGCLKNPQVRGKLWHMVNGDPQDAYTEYAVCICDLLANPIVQRLGNFEHHQNVSRLAHSLNVSFTSYSICRKLGWDYRSAARGGLLHDLFFYDWHTTTLEEGRHGFVHPQIALNNASQEFDLNNLEKDIILKHMFPLTLQPPGYKESLLVSLIDTWCAVQEVVIFGISHRLNIRSQHLSYLEQL